MTGPRAGERLRLIRIRIGLGLRPLDHGLHGNGGLAVVGDGLVQLEGERGAGADDGGLGRSLHTREGRRSGQDGAAQLHDPEVEALEEVQAGDLALGAQDGLGICAQGSFVPGENLLVGERRPGLRDLLQGGAPGELEDGCFAGRVALQRKDATAVLITRRNPLCRAGEAAESDGRKSNHRLKYLFK